MAILLAFSVIFVLVLVVILLNMRVESVALENALMQTYMTSLQSFYKMIQDRIEATRRYRHDLAKHIQTLEVMLQQEEDRNIQEYLDGLKIQYRQLKCEEYSTNEVFNTVLSIKKQQCEEKDLPFALKLDAVDYGVINDIDIVGLFYNLLDNAIEASERVTKNSRRGIRLAVKEDTDAQEQGFWITVENYVDPDEEIRFETRKAEKEDHGVGMKIIDMLVKKYHGKKEIVIDSTENLFTVKVWIPENQQK